MASTTTGHPLSNGHLPTGRLLSSRTDTRRPEDSRTAAASHLTSRTFKRSTHERWQEEAWDFYDEVGELRFVANAIANAMSHARLYVARVGGQRDDPEEVEDGPAVDVFDEFGGGRSGKAELLKRLGVQLFVPGDGWLIGMPPHTLELDSSDDSIQPEGELRLADLEWSVFSTTEVKFAGGRVQLELGGSEKRIVSEDRCYPIRVWRPHPRRWWTADSPVRANLPVLRELVGLTKHISANIDSRLAGAGMLVLPESVDMMGLIAESPDEDDDPESSPFLDALMDAMITPMTNRDSASAVVPVIVKVPDEIAANIGQGNLISFSTPFDERSKELRDESIRRLALGLDTTPEMLLGMGGVNHWSAWLLDEINVKIHIDPVLSLICDALTVGFLRPALEASGVRDADEFVVWWDIADLTLRPDRSGEAQALHAVGAISDEALRRANGFDEADAPIMPDVDEAVARALDMATAAPSLLQAPGLSELVRQLREVLQTETDADESQAPLTPADPPATGDTGDEGSDDTRDLPDTQGEPPDPGLPASSLRRPVMPMPEGDE